MHRRGDAATRPRRFGFAAVMFTVLASLALTMAHPAPAFARWVPSVAGFLPRGLATEVRTQTLPGERGVGLWDGLHVAPAGFDPVRDGYPDDAEVTGWAPFDTEGQPMYLGTIGVMDRYGNTGLTYCIDLDHETTDGVNYKSEDWTDAHVPNIGYVEYIITHYYPFVSGQPAVTNPGYYRDDDYRAAAVQAAIWFFTDKVALAPVSRLYYTSYSSFYTSVLHNLTVQIVKEALDHGPVPEPHRPTVTITPAAMAVPLNGEIVGPFTVTADGPATIRTAGVEVFTDQAGTQPLQDGDQVEPGAQLWARVIPGSGEHRFVLDRVVRQPTGTVYLYDGTSGLEEAQKLILAADANLAATASATLEPFAPGNLRLTKVIGGPAAGLQGDIRITVSCPATSTTPGQTREVTIPAGTPAGALPHLLTGLPAGATCTITETSNGSNDQASLTRPPGIYPSSITITEDSTGNALVTDSFCRPGITPDCPPTPPVPPTPPTPPTPPRKPTPTTPSAPHIKHVIPVTG